MERSKVYIAGPMTGYKNWNYEAFDDAARMLREKGYQVLSPSEIDLSLQGQRALCMRKAIGMLLECQYIYLLPGWEQSKGATLEKKIADEIGVTVLE